MAKSKKRKYRFKSEKRKTFFTVFLILITFTLLSSFWFGNFLINVLQNVVNPTEEFKYNKKFGKLTCGDVTGSSTNWSKDSRNIKIKCISNINDCRKKEYTKTFFSTIKTSYIVINDNYNHREKCPVNVYVDRTPPKIEKVSVNNGIISVISKDSDSGIDKICISSTNVYKNIDSNNCTKSNKIKCIKNGTNFIWAFDKVGNLSKYKDVTCKIK